AAGRLDAGVAAVALGLAGCTAHGPDDGGSGRTGTPSPATSSSAPAPDDAGTLGMLPSKADRAQAEAAVSTMTLSELAGQVLIAEYGGTSSRTAASLVRRLHLGGVIIMGDNVPMRGDKVDTRALRKSLHRIAEAARTGHRSWPAMIGVDQEGGEVERLGPPLTRYPHFMADGAANDPTLTTAASRAQGAELRRLGFTIDFAPDADVTMGARDPIINVRSAGGKPGRVGRIVSAAVTGFTRAGIVSTVKHFPGHGTVDTDSHKSLPVQSASKDELRRRDWKPFRAAVADGAPVVMVGHIAATALEPGVPASLSAPAYRTIRHDLHFTGVTMTDALNMGAITGEYTSSEAAVKAIKAGADVALMPADVTAAHSGLMRAVRGGSLSKKRLTDAAAHAAALMIRQQRAARQAAADDERPDAASAVRRLAQAAITQVKGSCRGTAVHGSMRIVGGSTSDRARLAAAARTAGIRVGSGPVVRLVTKMSTTSSGDVAVALDGPWQLPGSTAGRQYAAFGHTPATMTALVRVLTGRAKPHGTLPIAVKGMKTVC
ncbi:glycoside hydrolase family 3 protein, partial [Spelaeicoccus albus]